MDGIKMFKDDLGSVILTQQNKYNRLHLYSTSWKAAQAPDSLVRRVPDLVAGLKAGETPPLLGVDRP